MQAQNVAEYQEIRKELAALKECITTYVGFVLVGSAAAVWGLAVNTSGVGPRHMAMALASILLAWVSVLVLFLLSYKFTSHNRCAGYCKLLMHEELEGGYPLAKDLFLWEICVDRLRASHFDKGLLREYCREVKMWTFGVENLEERVCRYLAPKEKFPASLKKGLAKSFAGVWLLLVGSGEKSGSWKFPVYVSRIFAAIDAILVSFAAFFLYTADHFGWLRTLVIALFCLLAGAWIKFLAKLYDQMAATEMVESFCWRFVPIRARLLHEFDVNLKYHLKAVSPASPATTKSYAAAAGVSAAHAHTAKP